MSDATFTLSAFGDEIAKDLETQLDVLNDLEVGCLDLRGAWGKNVVNMDEDDLAQVTKLCDAHHIRVACIGSPIGKSPIKAPLKNEINNLQQIFKVGEAVGCRRVRMFSFYPPDTSTNEGYDAYVETSAARLSQLAALAAQEGFTLLLENEKGIVTDTLDRCEAVITAVDDPHLRFLWDPANFVQVGEAQAVTDGWDRLGRFVGYVHIKDAVLEDGHVVPAGQGDGQVRELLIRLRDAGYQGVLALEPHLKIAGHSTGHSGADGMRVAVAALREVMHAVGCEEVKL